MWDLFYFGRNICVATANLQPLGEVIEKEPSGPEGYVYAIINPSFNGLIKLGCASITVRFGSTGHPCNYWPTG